MTEVTAEVKKALKGRGIICLRDGEHYAARVLTVDGVLDADELRTLTEAAEKYGNGNVALTTRLQVEVQGIPYENIEPFCAFLEEHGLTTGGTGSKVRPIVCCKGTVCTHGLIDTQALARELHEKFYLGWHGVTLPHKFKIGIGGCPNNCAKPDINDFGIMGQRTPDYCEDDCKKCRKCAVVNACPVKAASVDENRVMHIDAQRCTGCGKCIDACNFSAVREKQRGYKIMVGGFWGKRRHLPTVVDKVFTHDELLEMLERSILLFRDQGKVGERFGDYIERIGAESFLAQLESGEVMKRKDEILSAELKK